MANKIKVAILGGGMGSLATAWRLTQDPADRQNYEITIYQRDWLLGGKGASTRNVAVGKGSRIEEHGIHLLLGFYNKALHLLRSVYAELAGQPHVPSFDDAIEPWDRVWIADEHPSGTWQEPWLVHFPADPGVLPGEHGQVPTTAQLLAKAFERLSAALLKLVGLTSGGPAWASVAGAGGLVAQLLGLLLVGMAALLPRPVFETLSDLLAGLVDKLVQVAWKAAMPLLAVKEVRRAWIVAYLFGTNVSGALRDRVLLDGTDALDALDYRDWLKHHQAVSAPAHVSFEAPPIRAFYDLSFSRRTGLAAGVSLGAIARMALGYEGHFTYKMRGGMGEVVFAPLYLALENRGVKFRFHHEVEELTAAPDGGDWVVEEIRIGAPSGAVSYANATSPVTGADGTTLNAWPSVPPGFAVNPNQPSLLRRGTDFDIVVLGIPVGALTTPLVKTLRDARPAFANMIDQATHVATQSIQLWMTKTGLQLGWPHAQDAMLISYARPFNSWVDMTHLLPKEDWPAAVKSVHYLCDELQPTEGTTAVDVEQNAVAWINTQHAYDWPTFQWDDLYDPTNAIGQARLGAQYIRANAVGSERYVTVGPDSLRHRLRAGESGFRNLALAGDWVRTQLSAGCLEAATTGGLDAAEAILGGAVMS